MVELSPPYVATQSSRVFEVQLQSEPLVRVKSKKRLPPTIPTLPRPCKTNKKIAKTYFVGIIPAPGKSKGSSLKGVVQEAAPASAEEQTDIEKRIAYRAGRATRFLFGKAFPALADEAILPRWHGESDSGPSLSKPTLSSLRRKRTVDFDRDLRESESQKALAPWRPADHSRKIDHPGNVALSRVQNPNGTGEIKPQLLNRRKTVTAQELQSIETRAAGRKRAARLVAKVRSTNRRNSVEPIPLAEFQERIRKAGEAHRANPPAIEDDDDSLGGLGSPSPSPSPRLFAGGSSSGVDSPTSQGSPKNSLAYCR